MCDTIIFEYLDKPEPKLWKKYKRIIWAGVRKIPASLNSYLNSKESFIFKRDYLITKSLDTQTIEEEVLNVGMFPVLVQWDNEAGEKGYAKIDRLSK